MASVHMDHSGVHTLYTDTSTGHQLQDECVPVPVQYLAIDADHLAVIHLASTVTCGDASQIQQMAITAAGSAIAIYAMNNTTAASVRVRIPPYIAVLDILKPLQSALKQ